MDERILAFDGEEDWKELSKKEKELSLKYILNITKLQKEGKSQVEINEMIEINYKKYLEEYKKLKKD